ncbi:uncharacterized protein LOC126750580 [Anthonomus grandis grandis]|uniref:uncharacterized protein LOC126750580 n=1 Tax=Anthonomus grandis grandis TaxID=2921223 RepID=UPI00216671B3|nr:uncharacterized protein LOC126750580 [Anthonomus grandis grandis]
MRYNGCFSSPHTNFAAIIYSALYINSVSFLAGCVFRKSWHGRWFQSGVQGLILINSTHIESKGQCYEEEGDKYLVFESDDCYRCLVLHEKHPSVLQYKESFCEPKSTLTDICSRIVGDAQLYSMFRKYPEVEPIGCPFKSAPFTFEYNRGTGDCSNPPSRAESCTDDSRLVLKYQACPDVPSTESNVEELVCLAAWKEGSTKYLIGKISQGNRRNLISDEDQYRCFIYQKGMENNKIVYSIAQSGDATCSGLQSPTEGSRTMKFTIVDDQHKRCRFPEWITMHHTWVSLDHHKTFKFSQKNATLKIVDDENTKPIKIHQSYAQPPQYAAFQDTGFEIQDQKKQNSEMRLVCHGILQQQDNKQVQIVAHVTAGCDSGYVCMVFYKREQNIIEIQQSDNYFENPDEACANFDPTITPYTTLVAPALHPKKCPHLGRYSIALPPALEKRKRREQPGDLTMNNAEPACISDEYEGLSVGCTSLFEMEFKPNCQDQAMKTYNCHGSWQEDGISYVIATPTVNTNIRKSHPDNSLRYCFMFQLSNQPQEAVIEGGLGKSAGPPIMKMSRISESCHRNIKPGFGGSWALNFTIDGTCDHSASDSNAVLIPAILLVVLSLSITVVLR